MSDFLPRVSAGPDREVLEVLEQLQLALLKHPAAGQALFAALVAEGRRFGATDEGAALRDRVANSDLIRRGRVAWEVTTMKLLEEDPPGVLPSSYLEALVKAAGSEALEPFLARLFEMGPDADPRTPITRD